MSLDTNEAAKKALIAYRQLEPIVEDGVGVASAKAQAESYDRILETLKQCFSLDKAFSDSVGHLKPLAVTVRGDAMQGAHQIEGDGRVLLATAHSFIELYLRCRC